MRADVADIRLTISSALIIQKGYLKSKCGSLLLN